MDKQKGWIKGESLLTHEDFKDDCLYLQHDVRLYLGYREFAAHSYIQTTDRIIEKMIRSV